MAKRSTRVRLNDPDPEVEDEGIDGVDGGAKAADQRTVRTGVEKSMLNILPRQGAGRPPGSRNALPAKITKAMTEALDDYPGGPTAYMKHLMVNEPATFGALLKRKLPQVVHADLDPAGLMARMLRAANAVREQQRQQQEALPNGAANLIDLTPTRTRSREYAVEDYDDAS